MRPPPVRSFVENDILSSPLRHRRATSSTGSIRPPSPRSFESRSPAAANNQALHAATAAAPPPSSNLRAEPPLPRSPVDPSIPRVGSRVKVSHKQETLFGRVLYVGQTHFSTRPQTIWAGIRLDEPSGNHDGEFKGERYFTCEPKHGLFQHLGNIKVIDNFDAPPAYSSPKFHSAPLAPASTSSFVQGALAQSLNTRRAANAPSSPRGTSTVPQMLCPSIHRMSRRAITSPVADTNTITRTRRNSSSSNSTNINNESILPITSPGTTHEPPTTELTASIIATNRDDLLDEIILEQILCSSAIHEKLAVMISEEVEREVNKRLQQVREDTTAQLTRETSFMSTFVNGAIQRIEDKITELKESIIVNAADATISSKVREQMDGQKLALAAIMEIASATKQQLQEEMKQRAEAIQQLRIMSEEETRSP